MKSRILISLAAAVLLSSTLAVAETFEEATQRAAADYGVRLQKAADELNAARRRIADEKAPLLKEMREAEDRIVAAQSQIERLETGQDDSAEQHRKLLLDMEAIRKNTSYISTLAHDGLAAFNDSLAPGEGQNLAERIQALGQKLDDASAGPSGQASVDIAEFLLERTRKALGGYTASGSSLDSGEQPGLQRHLCLRGPRPTFCRTRGAMPGR